ncbi:hypothetical protein D3C76_1682560 [compost metagenome]
MNAALLLDHRLGHVIQNDQALVSVFHPRPGTSPAKPCGDQEHARSQFRYRNLPIPLKLANFLLPASRVDLEQGHGLQVRREFGEQDRLLFP